MLSRLLQLGATMLLTRASWVFTLTSLWHVVVVLQVNGRRHNRYRHAVHFILGEEGSTVRRNSSSNKRLISRSQHLPSCGSRRGIRANNPRLLCTFAAAPKHSKPVQTSLINWIMVSILGCAVVAGPRHAALLSAAQHLHMVLLCIGYHIASADSLA